ATLRQAEHDHQLGPLLGTSGRSPELLQRAAWQEVGEEVSSDANAPWTARDDSRRPATPPKQPPATRDRPAAPEWKSILDDARRQMAEMPLETERKTWPADRRIIYIVDLTATMLGGIRVELATERQTSDGTWEPPAGFRVPVDAWQRAPDPVDRQLAQ